MTYQRSSVPLCWAYFLALLISPGLLEAQLSVSRLFSDHMVLQRNQPIRIWGEAAPGTAVNLELHTQLSLAFANEDGQWEAILGALPVGGPYALSVGTSSETLVFDDILIGEVWVCAGQSNMEWELEQTPDGAAAIAAADWPEIRVFNVPKKLESSPSRQLQTGDWKICTPENSPDFSAVTYYFGRHLHLELGVPIGLIDISWGGTRIDTWISPDGLAVFPELASELSALQNLDIAAVEDSVFAAQQTWDQAVEDEDIGLQDNWWADSFDASDWSEMLLPKPWEADMLPSRDGSVWFKKNFSLSSSQTSQDITLSLGRIDDSDQTWINGQLVGSTERDPGALRQYNVPANMLRAGENNITCRVRDYGFIGGLLGGANEMKASQNMWQISLAGYWTYEIGTPSLYTRPPDFGPNDAPSLIFNGMVAPVTGLPMAGVIWYQGESDTGNPFHYRDKQVKIIDDWRNYWGIGDFPFITTQLPYFRQPNAIPSASSWATLRESQTFTLKRDNTALTTNIDSGDPFNIHPNNKELTGNRLAEDALRLVYGVQNLKADATYFLSIPVGSEIHVYFHTYGSPITSPTPDNLNGFAIAGEDGNFVWANARILNSQSIAVSHPDVPQPRYVRYAWSDNPGTINFFNSLGRPVGPFRTDELPTPYE